MDWDIIEKLAVALGIKPTAVAMWRQRGEVPRAWHLAMLDEAVRRKWKVRRGALGIPERERNGQPE